MRTGRHIFFAAFVIGLAACGGPRQTLEYHILQEAPASFVAGLAEPISLGLESKAAGENIDRLTLAQALAIADRPASGTRRRRGANRGVGRPRASGGSLAEPGAHRPRGGDS